MGQGQQCSYDLWDRPQIDEKNAAKHYDNTMPKIARQIIVTILQHILFTP
jgi:hypothetical protein